MSTHQVPICPSLFSAYEQYFRVLTIKPNKPMKISSPKLSTNTNIGLLRILICTHLINHCARINTYIKKTPSQILIRTNKEYPDAYIHESYRRKHGELVLLHEFSIQSYEKNRKPIQMKWILLSIGL